MANRTKYSIQDMAVIANFGAGMQTLIEEATATVTYVGYAEQGEPTSASTWLIKKIDTSSGTAVTHAGSADFTEEWDERASLSYS